MGHNNTHNATPIAKVNMTRILLLILIMFISIKGVTLFFINEMNIWSHPRYSVYAQFVGRFSLDE